MTGRFVVCPGDNDVFRALHGRSLVPRSAHLSAARGIADQVRSAEAHLHCLWVETQTPLSALLFGPELRGIPLALAVPSMGGVLAALTRQLSILRELDLRIYLSARSAENLSAIRVLSSLGLETAADLRDGCCDWEALGDLMTYALVGKAGHAPIAPFQYLARRYRPHDRNDYSAVYFDDPASYVHVDADLHVALSAADLADGRFVGQGTDAIDNIERLPAYQDRRNAWRQFFLQPDGCAYCAGWRVCVGRFAACGGPELTCQRTCQSFAAEFLDVVEQAVAAMPGRGGRGADVWQP